MVSIVFDLDGTLIDSAPDIHRVANLVLKGQGVDPITLKQTRNFIGNGSSVLVEKMRAARDLPQILHNQMLAEFMAHYIDAYELTTIYPGVTQALEGLIGDGHQLGICTNKPIEPCKAILRNLELEGYFNTVWGGDSMSVRKPDPTPLHAAFNALKPDVAGLYVGDSEVDAETAQRADVPFLLFTEGYRKSDINDIAHTVTFSNFSELQNKVLNLTT